MYEIEQGGDKGLDMHHDASEITLNVCLSTGFTGAGLRFCGEFGSTDHRITSTVASHQRGRAIVHLGRQVLACSHDSSSHDTLS